MTILKNLGATSFKTFDKDNPKQGLILFATIKKLKNQVTGKNQ